MQRNSYSGYENPPPTNPYYQLPQQHPHGAAPQGYSQRPPQQVQQQQGYAQHPYYPQGHSQPPQQSQMAPQPPNQMYRSPGQSGGPSMQYPSQQSVLPGGYPADPKERPLPSIPQPAQQSPALHPHQGGMYQQCLPPQYAQGRPPMNAQPIPMAGHQYGPSEHAGYQMAQQGYSRSAQQPNYAPPPGKPGQYQYYPSGQPPNQSAYSRSLPVSQPNPQAYGNRMPPPNQPQMMYAPPSPQPYYMIVQQPFHGQPGPQMMRPPPPPKQKVQYAEARYEFSSEGGEFLSFVKGDKIEITGQEEDNYYRGVNLRTQEEGIFPAKYVRMQQS